MVIDFLKVFFLNKKLILFFIQYIAKLFQMKKIISSFLYFSISILNKSHILIFCLIFYYTIPSVYKSNYAHFFYNKNKTKNENMAFI